MIEKVDINKDGITPDVEYLAVKMNKIIDWINEQSKKQKDEIVEDKEKDKTDDDPIMTAWGIIANVSNGDWTKQKIDWQNAAIKWRDEVFSKAKETKTLSEFINRYKGAQMGIDPHDYVEMEHIKQFIKDIKQRISNQTGNECDAKIARDYAKIIIDEEAGKRLI